MTAVAVAPFGASSRMLWSSRSALRAVEPIRGSGPRGIADSPLRGTYPSVGGDPPTARIVKWLSVPRNSGGRGPLRARNASVLCEADPSRVRGVNGRGEPSPTGKRRSGSRRASVRVESEPEFPVYGPGRPLAASSKAARFSGLSGWPQKAGSSAEMRPKRSNKSRSVEAEPVSSAEDPARGGREGSTEERSGRSGETGVWWW